MEMEIRSNTICYFLLTSQEDLLHQCECICVLLLLLKYCKVITKVHVALRMRTRQYAMPFLVSDLTAMALSISPASSASGSTFFSSSAGRRRTVKLHRDGFEDVQIAVEQVNPRTVSSLFNVNYVKHKHLDKFI